MSTDTLRLGLCAGEASGDILAGSVLRSWKQRGTQLDLAGIGGERMQAEGLNSICAIDRLAVMGSLSCLSGSTARILIFPWSAG